MRTLRVLIRYALFPLNFCGALWFGVVGLERGLEPTWVIGGILAVTIPVIAMAERILPFHGEWNVDRGDVGPDLVHNVVSQLGVPTLMDSLLKVAVVSIFAEQAGGGPRFWPGDAPLLLQLALALIVTQFFEYWWHRLSHEHPILWRLHATHHSPHRLYWLNAGRFHPLDTVGSVSVSLLVVMCLGAEGDLVVMLGIWVAVHGLYQHCNVDLRLGPLNYIFSMAELHRWHHSRVLEEANANYGNNIILWDLVFGTFYWPQDRQPSSHIGLSDHPNFPTEYWGQVMSPFRWHSSRHDGSQEDSSTGGPSS